MTYVVLYRDHLEGSKSAKVLSETSQKDEILRASDTMAYHERLHNAEAILDRSAAIGIIECCREREP